jgi:hypothetical protein
LKLGFVDAQRGHALSQLDFLVRADGKCAHEAKAMPESTGLSSSLVGPENCGFPNRDISGIVSGHAFAFYR